ncbi:M56 family metallopeptidase [Blastococcus sp. DSM 46786]|uniref:M56 family metallopeptidase n=1 Tax=Blastococcus sp. DSM 46786 TaxID=1798227 RepID=UPI000B867763|nr:M56 family metallopeptidase [Blastococcus sp. DSM 46786]
MTGVLILLAGSTLVGLYGQRPLLWLADRQVDPTTLLTGWVLSAIGFVISVVAIIGLLAAPAERHGSTGVFHLAGGCWAALSSGELPGWREALAVLSITGVVAILSRIGWAMAVRIRCHRERSPHLARLRLLAAGVPSGEPLWVGDHRPMAMSIGGRPGVIVMSDALRDHLTPAEVAATLEHERAHLRGRHHALVAIIETLAAALPVIPLLRAAPSAVKDLVELAADAQAARRCGQAAVREALSRLTGQPMPAVGLAMAGRLTHARLLRLATASFESSRMVRTAGCAAIAVAALALPGTTGWLVLNAIDCVIA